MNSSRHPAFVRALASILALVTLVPALPAQSPEGTSGYSFRVSSELVLVNVVVRDKNGKFLSNLPKSAFTILEDGKPQAVSSFDFETTDVVALPPVPEQQLLSLPAPSATAPTTATTTGKIDLNNRRLIVLFFDLTSLDEIDTSAAVQAARTYVQKQMTPADLVGVVALSTSFSVLQDFTSDRRQLMAALSKLSFSGEGFAEGETGDSTSGPDTGEAFTPDDSEFNTFNTDRRLQALQQLSESLARIEQKKSIIYFSSGMNGTGLENRAQLRNTINGAVSSNVSIYAMDSRGLQAMVPGGEASQASMRGTGAYSGKAMQASFDANFNSQETLATLASDTGGRAFMDSNDFSQVFNRVQQDTSAYYLLGYRSTNTVRDGRYRHITVKVNVPDVKLEFRRGYYAPRDFAHSGREDREQQLRDELASDLSSTDLDVYLSAAYFRLDSNRFYVPVSLLVPGSQIPFTRSSDKDKATLDIIGLVRDELNRPVGSVRDTIKLDVDPSQSVQRRNVQYQTGFDLPPGKYHLKFVLRENQSGRMGSFETDISIPDLRKASLKMSAVMLGTQIRDGVKSHDDNPLIQDGKELVPNITHVFNPDQRLYFYYEVYDPAKDMRPAAAPQSAAAKDDSSAKSPASAGPEEKPRNPVRVLTSIAFFRGKTKVYESPLVVARDLSAPRRKAAIFQFGVPLDRLQPGLYLCQVNVIDDAAGTFTFPRVALLIRDKSQSTAMQ
jgi:VWFA-related protein